jgi:hypothetical protein
VNSLAKEKIKEKGKNELNSESKERKEKQKGFSEKQIEKMVDDAVEMIEEMQNGAKGEEGIDGREPVEIKASRPIAQIKKGDKIKIDEKEYEVDAHYVLIDHGNTKEMALEIFDPQTDKDYQLRYFNDQLETTLELYELEEIMYFKKPFRKIEW